MSLAKEINNKLEQITKLRAEIKSASDAVLIQQSCAELDQIKNDLNKLTNNGQNINQIFTNKYYINDLNQN